MKKIVMTTKVQRSSFTLTFPWQLLQQPKGIILELATEHPNFNSVVVADCYDLTSAYMNALRRASQEVS